MSDILIRGMEMPSNCLTCPLFVCEIGDPMACRIGYQRLDNGNVHERRPEWCPMIEISPPHGRLIDAAEVLQKASNSPWFDGDQSELGLLLGSEVTTIVPAEGGAEDGN